ncbi:uncharacterized protein DUF3429 [Kushneria sinocarnis]|uniref:Uncharacterized protein DUF3429 n=1 Tax=Kushneria sinocarnis TaxID=595502 RepID=A0A420WZ97_9GAMM|nr:DUF3429 domain-containing protein [Kushneria sinocarnis]RKR06612.1 uncharacterized protein DUF3429 [Kushneria sinocarnis]
MNMLSSRTPGLPLGLGLAGLLPFLLCAAIVVLMGLPWQAIALQAFIYYSAVILSFLGGIHWGVAMSLDHGGSGEFNGRMIMAMAPSLIAWPALMLDARFALLALMAGFLLVRLYERQSDSIERLPGWYRALRTLLTVVVVLIHLVLVIWLSLLPV